SRGRPIVYMTMRDRFDHLLLGAAVARGAIVLAQRTVESVQVESGRVRIGTSAGEVEASFVIAADGANSTVARAAGWTEDRLLIPALECEVSVAPDVFAAFAATARFDFDVIPFGYAWSFPKKCHLSMGVLTLRPGSANLIDRFAAYVNRLGVTPTAVERHGYVIPLSPRRRIVSGRRVLLCGDAAGLADPVTAEGITF